MVIQNPDDALDSVLEYMRVSCQDEVSYDDSFLRKMRLDSS